MDINTLTRNQIHSTDTMANMKSLANLEWSGSIKYYTVKTGNVSWKGCTIMMKYVNSVWCCDVMLASNMLYPAISFKLVPSNIKRLICKKRLVLEFQDGLLVHFNPESHLIPKISTFFEEWKVTSNSPKGIVNRAEVCVFTPLTDKRMNKSSPAERPVRHACSGKENSKIESIQKDKTARKKESKLFEDTTEDNGQISPVSSKPLSTPKCNGDQFLHRAAEKSHDTLSFVKTNSFYGKNKSSGGNFKRFIGSSNSKRNTNSNSELTPVKRPRLLVDLSSNSQPTKSDTFNSSVSSTISVSKLALRGLTNLGNTCYLNAILQSLFSLETFANELLFTNRKVSKANPSSLHSAMANLLISQTNGESDTNKLTLLGNVRKAISTVQKHFSSNDMQDAHECLNQVLDRLKEEGVKISTSTPSPNKESIDDDPSGRDAFINPTIQNFEFEVEQSIICKRCGEVVSKVEQYIDLSLDIPKGCNPGIQDALDLFFAKENVDYRCAKCNHDKSEVSKYINRLPRVFILHLKRYAYSITTSRNTKVAQHISIPKYLTLSPHCSETIVPAPSINNLIISPPKITEVERELTHCRRLDYTDSGNTSRKRPLFDSNSEVNDNDLGVVPFTPLTTDLPQTGEDCGNLESENTSSMNGVDEEATAKNSDVCLFDDLDLTKGMFGPESVPIPENCSTPRRNVQKDSPTEENGVKYVSNDVLLSLTDEERMKLAIENSLQLKTETNSGTEDEASGTASLALQQEGNLNSSSQIVCNTDPLNLEAPLEPENELTDMDCYDAENKENQQPVQSDKTDMAVAVHPRQNGETTANVSTTSVINLDQIDISQEDEDLKKAKAMSLIDLDDGYPAPTEFGVSVEETLKRSKEELEMLQVNAVKGQLPHSYQLVSVVAHIGNSSVSGHYLSDVLDIRMDNWYSFDDKEVQPTNEKEVQTAREDSGYIFFYLSKDIASSLRALPNKVSC